MFLINIKLDFLFIEEESMTGKQTDIDSNGLAMLMKLENK